MYHIQHYNIKFNNGLLKILIPEKIVTFLTVFIFYNLIVRMNFLIIAVQKFALQIQIFIDALKKLNLNWIL